MRCRAHAIVFSSVLIAVASCTLNFDKFEQARDAAVSSEAGVDASCPEGVLTPVAAVVLPVAESTTCAPNAILEKDDFGAGADWDGEVPVELGTESAGSCVGVDFGASVPVATLWARLQPVGRACANGCSGSDCGTGHTFHVATSDDLVDFSLVAGSVEVTGLAFSDYPFTIASDFRYALICRNATGAARDDISVDAVWATCN